jgi:membrane protease YdiL (CAAX protease family)
MLAPMTDATPRIRWGLGDFAWAWPAVIVSQVLIGTVVFAARGGGVHYRSDAVDIAVVTVLSAIVAAVLLAWLARAKGLGSLFADFGFRIRAADTPWIIVGLVLQGLAIGAVALITKVAGSEPQQDVTRALEHSATAAKVVGALAVVVAAPIAEELLFRGLLLRGLLRRFGAPAAVMVSAAVFALVHLIDPNAVTLVAPLALVGVVSGIRAVRTGELSQSIFIHAGFNLFTAVVLLSGL